MRQLRQLVANPPFGLPGRVKLLKPLNPILDANGLQPEEVNPEDGRVIQKLKEPIRLELMDKMEMGAGNSYIYRFALPGRDKCLGHYTCQFLQLQTEIEG